MDERFSASETGEGKAATGIGCFFEIYEQGLNYCFRPILINLSVMMARSADMAFEPKQMCVMKQLCDKINACHWNSPTVWEVGSLAESLRSFRMDAGRSMLSECFNKENF